jgi:hypothetical protein
VRLRHQTPSTCSNQFIEIRFSLWVSDCEQQYRLRAPSFSATAVLTSEDFAERLEKAIARSGVRMPRTIDGKAVALRQPE